MRCNKHLNFFKPDKVDFSLPGNRRGYMDLKKTPKKHAFPKYFSTSRYTAPAKQSCLVPSRAGRFPEVFKAQCMALGFPVSYNTDSQ